MAGNTKTICHRLTKFISFCNFSQSDFSITLNMLSRKSAVYSLLLKNNFSLFQNQLQKDYLIAKDDLTDADISTFKESSLSNFKQRRALMATLLQCDEKKLDHLISRYPRFSTVLPETVKEKLETYHSYNLPIELLYKNPRCLWDTGNQDLNDRLKQFQDRGLLDDLLGPQNVTFQSCFGFYLECDKEVFEKSINYLSSNLSALEGCSNLPEYLKYRLKCTELEAQTVCKMHVVRRGISYARIKELLDFALNDAGFSAKVTLKCLNLLMNSSMTKLQSRLSFYQEHLEHEDKNK